MLNVLKYDFYKIIKSRKMYFLYVFAFLTIIPITINSFFLYNKVDPINTGAMSVAANCNLIVIIAPIFASLLVGLDFSKMYIKNVYTSVNKYWYVLSKFIYIVLFCIIYQVLQILINWLGGSITAEGLKLFAEKEIESGVWKAYLLSVIQLTVVGITGGSIAVMLVTLLRIDWVPMVATFVYHMFLRGLVQSIGCGIFKNNDVVYSLFPLASHSQYRNMAEDYFDSLFRSTLPAFLLVAPFNICFCWVLFSYFVSVFAMKYRKV